MRKTLTALLVVYALIIIYVDVSVLAGQRPPGSITPISTLIGFTFALLHAAQRMQWKKTLGLFACVFVISLAFESVGVATGLIYGPYHYTLKLGALFLGLVAWLIPVAWFMMMYPSFVIADRLTPRTLSAWTRLLILAAIGGVIMTAWDVIMDPIMVRGEHWVWEVDGAFFGIPLQNYWGWWLTVFVVFGVFQISTRTLASEENPALDRMAITLYALTGASQIIIGLFTDLAGPALAGLFAMLPWVVMGWKENK